jgi:Domain of Unknown Function (DUF1206)
VSAEGSALGSPGAAANADRQARRSPTLAWAVRGGLIGYAVVHLLFAWVAIRLVFGARSQPATGRGALAELAGDSAGRLTLGALAAGFAALAFWQLTAAAVGYRDRDGWSRHLMRIGAACRVPVYGYLAVAAAGLALTGGAGSGSTPETTTAKLMALPAGPWLVAAVGATAVGVGVGLTVFGWGAKFVDQLDEQARTQDRRVPIVVLGRVGYVAKGLALVVIGVLLGWAAWSHDPQRSGGLDQALHDLLGGSLGTAAVIAVGAGIGCFGLYLLARARHLNRRSLTS